MREDKKPVIRLVRNKDGTLRAIDNDEKHSQLKNLWSSQSTNIEIDSTLIKTDFKAMINSIKSKKNNNLKKNNQITKNKISSTNNNVLSQVKTSQNNIHTIAITIPKFNIPNNLVPTKINKSYIIVGTLSTILVLSLWIFWPNNKPNSTVSDANSQQQTSEVAGKITYKVKPDYALMSPDGKGVDSLGGYALITPENEPNKAYAYVDKINDIPIKITQQKLPDSIKQDGLKLQDLANQFNAKEQIEIDDRIAYIGTSIKGPQSVIFAREDIMVLIASDAKISNQEWVKYLGSLRF